MTLQEYLDREDAIEYQWAQDSNATDDQEELFRLAEKFIQDHQTLMALAGGHPARRPPRVRP